jgi:hypothetical protein
MILRDVVASNLKNKNRRQQATCETSNWSDFRFRSFDSNSIDRHAIFGVGGSDILGNIERVGSRAAKGKAA